jgi:hypothetical protein
MEKGTLTPNEMGGFDLEIKNVSGDWKSKAINTAVTLGMAMITGAVTYAGQYLASVAIQKMQEKSAKKKEEQK